MLRTIVCTEDTFGPTILSVAQSSNRCVLCTDHAHKFGFWVDLWIKEVYQEVIADLAADPEIKQKIKKIVILQMSVKT